MTIENMRDDERDMLQLAAPVTGVKALRIIDALTSENERLRASIECLHGMRNTDLSTLTEATRLIRDFTYPNVAGWWWTARQAFLANQPAAPTLPPLNLVEDRTPEQLAADGDAAPARTEADRAAPTLCTCSTDCEGICPACRPIARRGLK